MPSNAPLSVRRTLRYACVGMLLNAFGLNLGAQTYRTWDDGHGSDDWSQNNNWSDNNRPDQATEVARFSNGNAGTSSIDVNSNQRTGGLLFDANLTIDITFTRATSELSIRNGGANYGITNNSSRTITFENQLGLEDDMTWAATNGGGGGLVFEAEVDGDNNTLTFDTVNASNFIEISGPVVDTGGIVKTGDGVLTLSGNNNFFGAIDVTDGVLSISSQANLGSLGANNAITLNGGTLRIDGGIVDNDDNTRPIVLGAGGGIIDTVAASDVLRWDNNITGTGNLTKIGEGTLRIEDPTNFTGDFIVNEGTVEFDGGDNRFNDAVDVVIAAGATLDVRNRSDDWGSLSGAGSLISSTGTNETVGFGLNNTDTEFSGTIDDGGSGSIRIEKLGTGNMTLSGDNDFDGTTTVVGGTLTLASDTALGTTAGNTAIFSGAELALTNDISIAEAIVNDGTVSNASGTNTISGVISGSGGVDVDGGTLMLTGTNTYAGEINVTGGGTLGITSQQSLGSLTAGADLVLDDGTLLITGGNTVDNDDNTRIIVLGAGGGTIDTDSALDVLHWDNGISGAGDLTKIGAGTLRLEEPTTFTGDLNINAGTVEFGDNDNRLNDVVDVIIAAGATLDVQDHSDDIGSLAGAGTLTSSTATNETVGFGLNDTDTEFSGTITDGASGTLSIEKLGDGNMTLSGNNDFDGTTTVVDGTLTLASNTALGSTIAETIVNSGATLAFTNDISVAEDVTNNGTIENVSGDNTFTGIASGTGDLIVNGGSLELTRNNTYTGGTTVNDGTLTLTTGGSVGTIRGELTVNSGGTVVATATDAFGFGGGSKVTTINVNGGTIQNDITASNGNLGWDNDWILSDGALLSSNGGVDSTATNSNFTMGNGSTVEVTSGTATIEGRMNLRFEGGGNTDFTVADGATLNVTAGVTNSNGVAGLTKLGEGEMVLGFNNTYAGDTNINAGTLTVSADNGLGATSAGTTVASGAALQLDGASVGNEALTLNGSGISSGGALRTATSSGVNAWAGSITLASASEIEVASGSSLNITGNISGGPALTVDGAGDATFTGTNTFTTLNRTGSGTLTLSSGSQNVSTLNVSGGTLAVGTSDIIANGADLNLSGTGTFSMAGGITETIDQFNQSGGTLNLDGVLTLNGGTISAGDGSSSTGTMVLTAGNTLNITSDYDFGGTLELTAGTTLALSGGSTFDLGTLEVTGNTVIDFGGLDANTLNLDSLSIAAGATIDVINWVMFQDLWTTGSFTGGSGAVTIDERDDNTAQITFNGFDASDSIWVTFDFGSNEITVPEPSSYGAVLIGFGLAMWTLRRRPRQTSTA